MPKLFIKTQLALFFAFFSFCLMPSPAAAGGGPENVLLVVNPKSPDSLTIANYYIHLRQIPAGNVFYLPWDPNSDQAFIDDFRSQILKPIIEAIHSRRLSAQIDYVIYSCDFPWAINLASDIQKVRESRIRFRQCPTRTVFNNRCRVIGLCPSRLRPSVRSTA